MKTICDCGRGNVDIFSVAEDIIVNNNKNISVAEIIYICKDCGHMESITEYLYKLKNNK